MSIIDVRAALITACKNFLEVDTSINTDSGLVTGLPVLPPENISYENRLFNPRSKGVFASVFYLPNTPTVRTVGDCGFNELTGVVQIDINIPQHAGEKILIDWERKAEIYFHTGRVFTNSGQTVIIINSAFTGARKKENFYKKSLSVAFRSDIKRIKVI